MLIRRPKYRKNNLRKILIIVAVLFAGFLTGTAAFGFMFYGKNNNNPNPIGPGSPSADAPAPNLDKRVSFLLIGADSRPGDDSFNADTLIVASVDPETKIISLLSVPRDTRVELAGSRFLKMNSMVMYRGIPGLMEKVTEITGIPLDGYIKTNFDGFKSIIDTLDGIEIYVERDMYYETGDKTDGVIDLKKGPQRLTGAQALQYARYRGDSLADISRTARQQNVIKAVAREAMQVSTITKLPKLIPQFMDVVETNLSVADMLKLSRAAVYFDSSNVISMTLPGDFLDFDEISYWEVNRAEAKQVAQNLLMGITTDRVVNKKVIDLLDPEIRAHVTVPGNKRDPNGVRSPGHVPEEDGEESEEGIQVDESQTPDGGDQSSEDDEQILENGDPVSEGVNQTAGGGENLVPEGEDQAPGDTNSGALDPEGGNPDTSSDEIKEYIIGS